jgi:hypothetical protein
VRVIFLLFLRLYVHTFLHCRFGLNVLRIQEDSGIVYIFLLNFHLFSSNMFISQKTAYLLKIVSLVCLGILGTYFLHALPS